ncbi:MAG: ATP-binding cassette domain-containing protein [Candidatus Omnitrophica bacterium]|nr:ATP-binding cassette domain-containing protein [Candidatus Omnitrophota bacterium]
MTLIGLREISLTFGFTPVFDNISLEIGPGERAALLGRNGSGKTTMMKVIAGEMEVDRGNVIYQKGVKVALLSQEVPTDIRGSVFDVVLSGLGEQVKLLSEYHHIAHRLQSEHTDELIARLGVLQAEIDHTGGWDLNNQVENVIARMKLDSDADFETLSGGKKRRALLARALVIQPDVLLLDEPTNHLDIDSIDWLEALLKGYPGTVIFVTHDRTFLTNVSTRIIELDRGNIYNWECDYRTFLERKQAALDNEAARWENFDKKLSNEEVWVRQGVKARRCREKGRVRELERLREEKRKQRKMLGMVRMQTQEAEISGHIAIKVQKIGMNYGESCLIRDFSTRIVRGDKIGLIGPNGSGKTTLIRILLGELVPTKGKARLGTNIEIAYYDQLRERLDEGKSIAENICGTNEFVIFNGKPRHITGYLQDFLFTPERIRTQVKYLSGGERNRLLLAKLFSRPANLLVMDEPTNDLDIETLELLEELLLEYTGTLLLVSHDRTFLNNVVTSTIVLEGEGEVNEYPGGYDDWLSQSRRLADVTSNKTMPAKDPSRPIVKDALRKLTFKERKELEELVINIPMMEEENEKILSLLADFTFYQRAPNEVSGTKARAETLKTELSAAYERWTFLEELYQNEQK